MAADKPPSGFGQQPIAPEHLAAISRSFAETASDAIITIDEHSIIVHANSAAEKIFGYTTEELIGTELTILMPEYLRHLHRAGLKQYLETGTKHLSWDAVELPGLHKSGREILLEVSFGEFQTDGRRLFTGIARDVTKRREDERGLALQHSVAQILGTAGTFNEGAPRILKNIALNLGWQFAAIWQLQDGQLRVVSHWRDTSTAETLAFEVASLEAAFDVGVGLPGHIWRKREPLWVEDFGAAQFARSSVAARSNVHSAFGFPIMLGDEVLRVIEFFSVNFKEADPATLDNLVAIGGQIAQYIERKRKEEQLVRALEHTREARNEAQELAKQLAALQRITDAALAHLSVQEVLAESLKRIREVLEVDTVAILLFETEGDELVAWAAQGLEEEVVMGVRIPAGRGFAGRVFAEKRPIIIEDVEHADIFNPILQNKGIQSLLGVPLLVEGRATGVLHVGKFESAHFEDSHVRLLEAAAARIALPIENARLYQEERAARAEAEAANQAKDEFLTILSHELRTPLTPIIGWIHMMQNGILPESENQRILSIVNRNAYNLKRLINDLLDMSAILTGKMRIEETPVSVASVLEESIETMRPYARDSKVTLRLRLPSDPAQATVKGDRNRLLQAFCNILHNAIKFSPAGGSVTTSCDVADDAVVVRVRDQGEGIPNEFLPHVFERFRQADASRTRSFGGLGLGLSLVKSFVVAHHGTVEADSEGPGKGSVFVVTLPREVPIESTTTVSDSDSRGDTKGPHRILLVEDQPDTLEMLKATLGTYGYDVVGCDSAAKALNTAQCEEFDLLVSDIGMPAMDGFQLIRDLRNVDHVKQIPAIALTGYASRKDADAAIAAGFDMHLSKPIDPAALADAIKRLLNSSTQKRTANSDGLHLKDRSNELKK